MTLRLYVCVIHSCSIQTRVSCLSRYVCVFLCIHLTFRTTCDTCVLNREVRMARQERECSPLVREYPTPSQTTCDLHKTQYTHWNTLTRRRKESVERNKKKLQLCCDHRQTKWYCDVHDQPYFYCPNFVRLRCLTLKIHHKSIPCSSSTYITFQVQINSDQRKELKHFHPSVCVVSVWPICVLYGDDMIAMWVTNDSLAIDKTLVYNCGGNIYCLCVAPFGSVARSLLPFVFLFVWCLFFFFLFLQSFTVFVCALSLSGETLIAQRQYINDGI